MSLIGPNGQANNRQNTVTGTTNGLFQAGAFVNTFITCYVLDKLGRKNTVYYNSILGLLNGTLLCGARNVGMFLAGCWFTGMSAWGFLILTPVYTAEIAPPDLRGLYFGLDGVHIGMGYFIAAVMGRAFAQTPGNAAWRAPLGIYLFFPLLLIFIMLLSPESPRWLLLNGKVEKAKKVIYQLHTVKGNTAFAEREFDQIQRQVAIDRTLETTWVSRVTIPCIALG
jgi:MFS family permease